MRKVISLLLSLLFLNTALFASEKTKIACVGDSITFGATIKKKKDRYPQQLGAMLDDSFEVKNFGKSGATLLFKGNSPYVNTTEYKEALAFKPDVVIIKLGTNDSKMMNWDKVDDFYPDLNILIDSFVELGAKPYLCTPCPAFKEGDTINENRILEIIPIIERVAKERGLVVIDLHKTLYGKEEMFPDKIHPNAEGAKLMAQTIKEVILADKSSK